MPCPGVHTTGCTTIIWKIILHVWFNLDLWVGFSFLFLATININCVAIIRSPTVPSPVYPYTTLYVESWMLDRSGKRQIPDLYNPQSNPHLPVPASVGS